MNELQKLASTKKKNAKDAKIALHILKRRQITVIMDETQVDRWIMKEASETGSSVCTNDTELRQNLRSEGINVMSLALGGQLR